MPDGPQFALLVPVEEMGTDRETELLEECRRTIRELQEENQQLRYSAMAFGRLAERLNLALRRAVLDGRPRREHSAAAEHHRADDIPGDR